MKSSMRNVMILVGLLLLVGCFLMVRGCRKTSDFDTGLIGGWVDMESEDGFCLFEDGTFSEGKYDDEGTFYTEGDRIILEAEGRTPISFTYKLAGNVLVMTDDEGSKPGARGYWARHGDNRYQRVCGAYI